MGTSGDPTRRSAAREVTRDVIIRLRQHSLRDIAATLARMGGGAAYLSRRPRQITEYLANPTGILPTAAKVIGWKSGPWALPAA